jgi:hypothetical protein
MAELGKILYIFFTLRLFRKNCIENAVQERISNKNGFRVKVFLFDNFLKEKL